MSEEIKISIPFFNGSEEAEIENKLLFHLDEFTDEIMRTITKDKDMVILKKVIERQQKEIEDLKEKNTQLTNYLNDSYYVSADKIREILKDLDEFDDYFFNVITLKEAIKNSLNRLLEEN